jgi:hypothetical protein
VVSRRRTLVLGGLAGAVLGFVLAPRRGETRRAAATRLRLALRGGRGAVAAFSGTPCAVAAPPPAEPPVAGSDGDATT